MIDTVIHGDALIELRKLPDNSIDALCCDPPAGISFMNKAFDHDRGGRKQWIEWLCSIMQEVYRVLKPGAHGLVWSLPRTSHWTATALEDAGFEIRDCIYHIFGSGFPKSLDVSKAIDRVAGVEREVVGIKHMSKDFRRNGRKGDMLVLGEAISTDVSITAPATPEAQQWAGWGSALKPACEQWWLIRKPLSESSIAANVLKWGTGAINIDACRIPGMDTTNRHNSSSSSYMTQSIGEVQPKQETYITGSTSGRFPSHLLLSHSLFCGEQCVPECPVAIMDAQSGYSKSTDNERHNNAHTPNAYGVFNNPRVTRGHNDQGGASRYFAQFRPDAPFIYASKASRKDRTSNGTVNNTHSTVKSQALMRYMLRLVVPPNGVVLDCFAGSGSTLCAAIHEGFHYIGIEAELEYIEIIKARIAHALKETSP